MRYCKNCGLLAPQDADRCPQCGAALPPAPIAGGEGGPQYRNEAPDTVPALSEWATLGALLLFAIPVVGFILTVAWSFGFTHNPARRRLAQAYLIRTLIVAVAVGLLCLWLALSSALALSVPYYYHAF